MPVLVANRLLHEGNIGLLAQACGMHSFLVRSSIAGNVPNSAALNTFRLMLKELGLLGIASQTTDRENRFTQFTRNGRRSEEKK